MTDASDTNRLPTVDLAAQSGQTAEDDWAAFQTARRSLAEVMSDDELREFGFNLEELDRKP